MTDKKKINRHDGVLAWAIVIAILIIDQVIKIEVKTSMTLGESIRVTDWFYINFIENNGMAWGMTFINKLFLSLLRIVAVTAIGWFIYQVVRQGGRRRFVVVLSMIAAGAAGNIFDSMFYGLIFSASSPYYVSYFVPFGTGYADFLMGKVVDMFYFPLIVGSWPDWLPFVGGEHFVFFSPVFNFADACITVGVLLMIILCHKDWDTVGDVIRTGLGKATVTADNGQTSDMEKKDERQKKDIPQRKEGSQ